jgi:hypothetical protein
MRSSQGHSQAKEIAMRRVCLSVVILGCVLALRAAAGDDQAKAVVDKAIKAMGGADKFAKFKAFTAKSEGKMFAPDFDYVEENSSLLPEQYHFEIQLSNQMVKIKQVMVFNGPKAWTKIENLKPIALPKEAAVAFQDYFYALRLAMFPTGLQEKETKLSLVGEVKVGDRPALGVLVSRAGKKDVTIYYDKQSALPVKMELTAGDIMAEKEVQHEFLFSQHKEIHGIQFPIEMVWNKDGKKFMTREFKDIQPVEKLEPGLFAEPK